MYSWPYHLSGLFLIVAFFPTNLKVYGRTRTLSFFVMNTSLNLICVSQESLCLIVTTFWRHDFYHLNQEGLKMITMARLFSLISLFPATVLFLHFQHCLHTCTWDLCFVLCGSSDPVIACLKGRLHDVDFTAVTEPWLRGVFALTFS